MAKQALSNTGVQDGCNPKEGATPILENLKIHLFIHPASALLAMYPKDKMAQIQNNICKTSFRCTSMCNSRAGNYSNIHQSQVE